MEERCTQSVADGSMTPRRVSTPARSMRPVALASCVLLWAVLRPFAPAPSVAAEPPTPAAEKEHDAGAGQPAENGRSRERLRYAQRSFEEWRDQLLNDLDPETCVKAMEPIAAFGKRGYADEAIAALAEVLRSDNEGPSQAAAGALAKLGPAALPKLVEGLADGRPGVRIACEQAIEQLGNQGRPAAKTLVKLLADQYLTVRSGAVQSLIAVAGDDEEFWPTFERLAAGNELELRYALAAGLSNHPPQCDWWLRPMLRLADDEGDGVRILAGKMLAAHGPPQDAVIDAVERLICDDNPNVTGSTVGALVQRGDPKLLAAVFSAGIRSPELWQHFFRHGVLQNAIARLASDPDQAETVAPLLAHFIEAPEVVWNQNETLAAIDALGRLGPAAKVAFPTLKRLIQRADLPDNDPIKKHAQRALDKILAKDESAADGN